MRKFIALFFLMGFVLVSTHVHAAGPDAVASIDRSLWPEPIDSTEAFDRASRAELLVFAHALGESEQFSNETLRQHLKLKVIDRDAIDHIRSIYWRRLTANYILASAHCTEGEAFCTGATDEVSLKRAAEDLSAAPPRGYGAWLGADLAFHRTYLYELLRLASLFPRVSSEVETYSSHEFTGSELPDRHFLLTFDDGPTDIGGNTEKLQAVLRKHHLNATFFVLGKRLQARLQRTGAAQLAKTYQGMCVGAHGWEHKSHVSWPQWQSSVTRTTALIRSTMPSSYAPLFRPPYGQRRADSGTFFDAQGLRVVLWNIDSQDWSSKVDANQVKQRVLTLMLLWRHGVILFHDIHAKAQTAVPWIFDQTRESGVTWVDCHAFPSA